MLFFRSEENARAWCRERDAPVRPLVRIEQLWRLSVAWYGTRLSPDSRRPQPDEFRAIFASVGLEDPHWDPLADRFG